jgi:hypothetical protein
MKRLSRFDFGAFLIITLLLVGLVYNSYSVGSSPRVVDPDLIPWIDPVTGAINVTKVYASVINATTGYVQIYKLIVENGTSFPASATAGYVFYYTPLNSLYFYNGSSWNGIGSSATLDYSSLTGKPDLSMVLCQNGSRPLLNNWNVGSYGIYGLTYVSTVGTIYCSGLSNVTLGGYVNTTRLLVEVSATAPASPAVGYIYFDTTKNAPYIYNGSTWNLLGSSTGWKVNGTVSGTTPITFAHGMPDAPDVFLVNAIGTQPYSWSVTTNSTHAVIYHSAGGSLSFYYYGELNYTGGGGEGGGGTWPDFTVYLFTNGTRSLTANWNVGSYGLYGLTFVNTTTLYCTTIDQLVAGTGVKVLKLVVENGSSFPASPIDHQIYFDYPSGYLYMRNNSVWIQVGTTAYGNLSGTPDLTVYLTKNGATALSGNWNVGGAFGIYGATWVNGTSISSSFWYQNGVNVTDVLAYPQQLWSYMIFQSGSNYFMKNGTTGQVDYSSTNLTLVEQYAKGNLTSGLIYLKEVAWNTSLGSPADNVMIVQQIQGEIRYISSQAKFVVPQLGADPNTTGWTQTEQGRLWFNTGEDTMKYWNGSAIVSFPSIGGGSVANGTYTLPFTYLIYQNGATGTYYCENSNGGTTSSTNASALVSTAIGGSRTDRYSQRKVVLQGNITIDTPILIYPYTELEVQGIVTLGANINNKEMLWGRSPDLGEGVDVNVWIHGGVWRCRSTADVNGYAALYIYANNTVNWRITDTTFWDVHNYSIRLDHCFSSIMDNIWCENEYDYCYGGIHLHTACDAVVNNIVMAVTGNAAFYGLYVEGGGPISVTNYEIGGGLGMNFVGATHCNIANSVFTDCGTGAIHIGSTSANIVFNGGIFDRCSNPNATYAFIYNSGDYCIFNSLNFLRTNTDRTSTYGIRIESGADYNLVVACTFQSLATAGVYNAGTGTKVHACIGNADV